MSLNKAMVIGNLGRDPETRYLPSGEAVTNFSVATTDKWKDKATGEMREQTEWHRISTFGRLAEIAGQYLKKGSQVYIEGKINTRKYEKDGVERTSTEIRATELKMLNNRQGGDQEHQEQQSAPSQPKPSSKGFEDMDDDIPF